VSTEWSLVGLRAAVSDGDSITADSTDITADSDEVTADAT
jgi:hypothetical protein